MRYFSNLTIDPIPVHSNAGKHTPTQEESIDVVMEDAGRERNERRTRLSVVVQIVVQLQNMSERRKRD